jgi:hypothetical protein
MDRSIIWHACTSTTLELILRLGFLYTDSIALPLALAWLLSEHPPLGHWTIATSHYV